MFFSIYLFFAKEKTYKLVAELVKNEDESMTLFAKLSQTQEN